MRVLIPFAMLVAALPDTMAFITIQLFSGSNCSGTKASTGTAVRGTCSHLNEDVHSGRTYMSSNGDCLVTYYGSNCEDGTIVGIQGGSSGCGDYWGTVRSVMAVGC